MARGNHIFLQGALARDPELNYTPSGVPIYSGTLAGEYNFTDGRGMEHNIPWYLRFSSIGKPAEWHSSRGYARGMVLLLEGSLSYRQWDDPQTGAKRSVINILPENLEAVDNPKLQLREDSGGGLRLIGGINEVHIIGHTGQDIEIRNTPVGDPVGNVRIAVREFWRDSQNNNQERTHWIGTTLWRELAEEYRGLKSGTRACARGRLVNSSWTDKDGNKRSETRLEAVSFEVLARAARSQDGEYGQAATAEGQPQRRVQAQRPAQAVQHPPQASARPAAAARPTQRPMPTPPPLDDFPPEEEDLPF